MRPMVTNPDVVIAGGVAVVAVSAAAAVLAVPACLILNGIREVLPMVTMTLRSIS